MSLLQQPDEVLRQVIEFSGMIDTCTTVQTCRTVRSLVNVPLLHDKRREFMKTSYHVMMNVLDDLIRSSQDALQLIEDQADVPCALDDEGRCALYHKLTDVMLSHQRNESVARQFAETFYFEDKYGIVALTTDDCFYANREAPPSFTKVVLDAWRSVANNMEFALECAESIKFCRGLCLRCCDEYGPIDYDRSNSVEDVMPYFITNFTKAKEGIARLVELRDRVDYLKTPPFPVECFTVNA